MLSIVCPRCRKRSVLSSGGGSAANDDEHHVAFVAPEGFRKVQLGWRSDAISLYCVDCAVPAVHEDN